jgi:hypothetical protein
MMNSYVCYVVDLCWDMKVVQNIITLIYCSVSFGKIFFVISNAWWNLILQTLIRSFLQNVPIVPNNYSLYLLLFLLKSNHESISHDLINEEYGLHILSLIQHLIPCFNLLLLTLDVNVILHIFAWGCYLIVLCPLPPILFEVFFLDFFTLHRHQPCLC